VLEAPGWDARGAKRAAARIIPIPLHAAAESAVRSPHATDSWDDAGVRWPLVTDARARIEAGHYDRLPVREWIADAVLLELRRP
jgi:hypothetical protein